MLIETEKFGDFDLKDSKVIDFPMGIPGFENLHKFIILEISESRPVYWLQSTENRFIALPVIICFDLVEDYYIEISEKELEGLQIESKNDLLIMNVAIIPSDVEKMTVNLAAPIVINAKAGIGKQIIIDAKELPLRYPIYDAIIKSMKGGGSDAGTL